MAFASVRFQPIADTEPLPVDMQCSWCKASKMIWLALAAQLSAPIPKESWLHPADFPSRLMSVNSYSQILLRVTVDPNGSIQSCGVEEPSESQIEAKVDAYTCDLTVKRATFLPARSANGKAAYGVYRLPVVWEMTPYVSRSFPDLTLQVNQLPSGIKSSAMIELVFAADPDGTVSSCEAKDEHQNAALARIGCDQLQKQFKAIAPKTSSGTSMSSIQNAFVEFRAK